MTTATECPICSIECDLEEASRGAPDFPDNPLVSAFLAGVTVGHTTDMCTPKDRGRYCDKHRGHAASTTRAIAKATVRQLLGEVRQLLGEDEG